MKRLFLILCISLLSLASNSQQIDNDTLTTAWTKGNWALRVDLGVHAQNMLNQNMVELTFNATMGFSVFYKDFFINYSYSQMDNDLKNYEIFITNNDISLGYNYNFLKRWSFDGKGGVNITSIVSSIREPEIQETIFINNENVPGVELGIGVNRYFRLRRFNFLVARFGIDYYTTNYKSLYSGFGKGGINYSLTLAYKGWYNKKVR